MLIDGLQASSALRILRYADIDHFRQALGPVQADITPLSMAKFAPTQAIVQLPDCAVFLLRTFPRMIDACFEEGGAMVFLTMEDSPSTTVNGIDVTFPAMALVRGKASYKVVERVARLNAVILFKSPMDHRGWPGTENGFSSFRLTQDVLMRLRAMIAHLFAFASAESEQWHVYDLGEAIQHSLLTMLDEAILSSQPTGIEKTASYRKQFRIAERVEQVLYANPSEPIYSDALAREIGVSIRTLHNATVQMRGISLHRYLRVRRLWMVRQKLASGDPSLRVKTCAMAHGFWHLGEFSATYSTFFGELPSRTLARARGQ